MHSPLTEKPKNESAPVLALRPRDAAKALSISERTLFSLTDAGEIPVVRVGQCKLYSVDSLRAWLESKAE